MAKVYDVTFTRATIDGTEFVFVDWCTDSREYVKAFNMQTYQDAKGWAGGGGYNRRGVAASEALQKLAGIHRDQNFFNTLSWRMVL
ncbi:MAG: hypothetical protein [Bacteriophage sp.]|nr:MAG: hypothetical protein [Bacteriophage sp.]QHJ85420.1 MAG: hypothetical protein [Caudoviricetes sp.]